MSEEDLLKLERKVLGMSDVLLENLYLFFHMTIVRPALLVLQHSKSLIPSTEILQRATTELLQQERSFSLIRLYIMGIENWTLLSLFFGADYQSKRVFIWLIVEVPFLKNFILFCLGNLDGRIVSGSIMFMHTFMTGP